MSGKTQPRPEFSTEQKVQDWLEATASGPGLRSFIKGTSAIETTLKQSGSPDFWPTFPIDYLSRLANLRAAKSVMGSLGGLTLVAKNTKNLSAAKGEQLFTDLLYCNEETSTFVVIEVKNQSGSVREAVTELLAYEHEILNHVPFSGSDDIKMVVVSREFSTLLDHAVTGLNTWTRRRVLCLRFDDTDKTPVLHIHIPKAWSAIGQMALPHDGVVTAALSFRPGPNLSDDQVRGVCETAAALMVREAERAGSSGFAIVARDQLYPGYADGPYLILAGVVNPFSFASAAASAGFLESASSPLADYILQGGVLGDLSVAWDWMTSDGGAAKDYLAAYGTASWGSVSHWHSLRAPVRWTASSVTPDRHLTPLSVDFWGVLGDYARDAVKRVGRMRRFKAGLAKPGLDWRHPLLGILLLDEVAGPPVVEAGQWTFSALFSAGMRLGRLLAFGCQFADADEKARMLLTAPLFWAEADAFEILQELAFRYVSAAEITVAPPIVKIGAYEDSKALAASVEALASWVCDHLIGAEGSKVMRDAFVGGLNFYGVFDPQFDATGSNPHIASVRADAAKIARHWLKLSVVSAFRDDRESEAVRREIEACFATLIPLGDGKDRALSEIDGLDDAVLIEALFEDIPRIVDAWHPQLAHTLGAAGLKGQDWDWFEEQICQARARGEKRPCIAISAGGHIGIATLPSDFPAPVVTDPQAEVLVSSNQSSCELILTVKWSDLRSGNVPGFD